MVKQQVDFEIIAINNNSLLSLQKGKPMPEFEDKLF